MPLVVEAKSIRYNHTYQANGINVNFANLLGLKEIKMRTYERGVEDETLSCGTGATAVALASAVWNGLPPGQHQVALEVMGGKLQVAFNFLAQEKRFTDIWLIGPANQVFKGIWNKK
jgi:diaminopimelate epimerase